MSSTRKHTGIIKLLLVSLGAFAVTFSLVPLYRIACEKVFGIRLDNTATSLSEVKAAAPDLNRVVTVEFDASVNSRLPWTFTPQQAKMDVQACMLPAIPATPELWQQRHPRLPLHAPRPISRKSNVFVLPNKPFKAAKPATCRCAL